MSYRFEAKRINHPSLAVERKANRNWGIWDHRAHAFVTDASGKLALHCKVDADRIARSANHLPVKKG
jgi:hypothetical protein